MLDTPEQIKEFYRGVYDKFGATPRGMAWTDEEVHWKRLNLIQRFLEAMDIPFWRVLDVGCGIGLLYRAWDIEYQGVYHGVDVVPEYVAEARKLTETNDSATVTCEDFLEWGTTDPFSVAVAVGTFAWQPHDVVGKMINKMWDNIHSGGALAFTFIPGTPLTPQEVRLIGVSLGAKETLMFNGYSNILNEHIAVFKKPDTGITDASPYPYKHMEEIADEVLRGEYREEVTVVGEYEHKLARH